MDNVLAEIARDLQASMSLTVGVGHPGTLDAEVALWPWRIDTMVDTSLPRRTTEGLRAPRHYPRLSLRVLVACRSVAASAEAIRCLHARAMLSVADASYRIYPEALDPALQVAIFHGAGLPLSPVACFVVEEMVGMPPALSPPEPLEILSRKPQGNPT